MSGPDPVCWLTRREPRQPALCPDTPFHPPPCVLHGRGFSGLLSRRRRRHCRRSLFVGLVHCSSTSLRPLAPRSLPASWLLRTLCLPPGGSSGLSCHEHRFGPRRVSLITVAGTSVHSVSNHQRLVRGLPGCPALRLLAACPRYRLRHWLAGSPSDTDRIEFTSTHPHGRSALRTGRSRSVAPHPASLQRSYGSIPHGSSPQGNGLSPFYPYALSGALAAGGDRGTAWVGAPRISRINADPSPRLIRGHPSDPRFRVPWRIQRLNVGALHGKWRDEPAPTLDNRHFSYKFLSTWGPAVKPWNQDTRLE
jgi:hypothetical protein